MENPAKYSTEALTHECFSSHISTLLSTVSGTPINNQQQQLVEFKSTFLVILSARRLQDRCPEACPDVVLTLQVGLHMPQPC